MIKYIAGGVIPAYIRATQGIGNNPAPPPPGTSYVTDSNGNQVTDSSGNPITSTP